MGSIRFPNLGFEVNAGNHFDVFNFSIAFYGIIIAVGMICGAMVAYADAKKSGQKVDDYVDYTIFGIIGAVIGARLYYVIAEWSYYKDNLLQIFNIRAGGLAIYGGIIGAVIVLLVFCKIKKYKMSKLLMMMDTIVLGLIVGQIIGRWGNFFNREAYGCFTDNIFAMQIPVEDAKVVKESLIVTVHGVEYVQVHPTFLYESFFNLILFAILMIFRNKKKFQGENLCRYLLGYGIIRFFIEGIRVDQLIIKGVVISQVLSAVLAVGSLAVIIVMRTRLIKQPNIVIPYEEADDNKTEVTSGEEVGENTTEDTEISSEENKIENITDNDTKKPQEQE